MELQLIDAAKAGRIDEIARLLDEGIDIDFKDCHGHTALHWAAEKGQQKACALLMERDADVYAADPKYGYTALHCAAGEGQTDCCSLLLDGWADIAALTLGGETPLELARESGQRETADFLEAWAMSTNDTFPAAITNGAGSGGVQSKSVVDLVDLTSDYDGNNAKGSKKRRIGGSERDSSYSGTSISGEAATERVSGGVHPELVGGTKRIQAASSRSSKPSVGGGSDRSSFSPGEWNKAAGIGWSPVVLKSPSDYVKELELDLDDGDISEELQQAVDAWRAVVCGGEAETVDMSVAAAAQDEGGVIYQLMTRLGTTYRAESHGSELRRIAASNLHKADHLCVADFADWFVRLLHAPGSSSDIDRYSDGGREKSEFFDANMAPNDDTRTPPPKVGSSASKRRSASQSSKRQASRRDSGSGAGGVRPKAVPPRNDEPRQSSVMSMNTDSIEFKEEIVEPSIPNDHNDDDDDNSDGKGPTKSVDSTSSFYIDGDEGVMLLKTSSLRRLLQMQDRTSQDILKEFWDVDGHIFSLIPRENFKRCRWVDLPQEPYAVMSYQWRSLWHLTVDRILKHVKEEYMFIDVFCVPQKDPNKMKTVARSGEIYRHANAYHLMEIGSLLRGWVLFELSSVPATLIPPIIHCTVRDPAMVDKTKSILRKTGFKGCEFSEDSDRRIVQKSLKTQFKRMSDFNARIIAIVESL